jgi:hypothetical protein
MPTQHKGYHLLDGTRVPSVTTILGIVDKPALKPWAFAEGRKSGLAEAAGLPYAATLRDVTKGAMEVGTIVHAMAEHDVKGSDPWAQVPPDLDPDLFEKVKSGFGAYQDWKLGARLEIVDCEVVVMSEEYRYGGTLDFIGKLNGKLVLGDFKTSNGIWPEYLCQLPAYARAYTETTGNSIDGGFHLLRFAKEHGDFAHHYFPNLDDGWEAFKAMRSLYDTMAKLKKRAA